MVKKCNILINNESVTVVDFDGVEVQMPSIKNIKAKEAFVCKTDCGYHFVDGEKCNIHKEVASKKKSSKKAVEDDAKIKEEI